jgi:hypothetical protein
LEKNYQHCIQEIIHSYHSLLGNGVTYKIPVFSFVRKFPSSSEEGYAFFVGTQFNEGHDVGILVTLLTEHADLIREVAVCML